MFYRKAFLVIISLVFMSTSLLAQKKTIPNKKLEFSIGTLDTGNNDFFLRNPKIKEVRLEFFENKEVGRFVSLKTIEGSKMMINYDFYDFSFMGDRILFEERYGKLTFNLPKIELEGNVWEKSDTLFFDKNLITISPDSVQNIYMRVNVESIHSKKNERNYLGLAAKPTVPIDIIMRKIESLNTVRPYLSEKVVFRASVSKVGDLEAFEQLSGQTTAFSELVKKVFETMYYRWKPAVMRRDIKSSVRILVELNEGGIVTIEMPKYLRNLSNY